MTTCVIEQDAALVGAVGEHAAEEHDDEAGHGVREVQRAEGERGVPEAQHEQPLGDHLHPGAGHGDGLADPDDAEVALAERVDRVRQAEIERQAPRDGGASSWP